MNTNNAEPSMEDILSSIKRIISEDSDAALATAPHQRRFVGGTETLLASEGDAPGEEHDVLELTDSLETDEAAEIAASLEPNLTMVSFASADASRSALAALSAMVVRPEVAGSDTLEAMVREMLRPMLAQWLDERLPEVVERMVSQEIHRITARG